MRDNLVVKINTAQKMKFSINHFFSKFEVTFTEEILHGKLHFSCNETLLFWTSKRRLGRYLLKLFMFIFFKLNSPSDWNDTNSYFFLVLRVQYSLNNSYCLRKQLPFCFETNFRNQISGQCFHFAPPEKSVQMFSAVLQWEHWPETGLKSWNGGSLLPKKYEYETKEYSLKLTLYYAFF